MFGVDADEPAIVEVARLHVVLQLWFELEHGQQDTVGLGLVVEMVPVVPVVGGYLLLLELGVKVIQINALNHHKLVHYRVILLQF